MPVHIGAKTEHGFDQPLGLMTDCHRRIEHFLGILEKVAQVPELCDEHRRAVEAALTYFDSAAPRHTADEEQSLFPLLREIQQVGILEAGEKMAALEADHARGNTLHAQIRAYFRQWLEAGSLSLAVRCELKNALSVLREMYRRHIEVEESEIFPLAEAVLSQSQLAQLGQEMAQRRGLSSTLG